MTFSFSSSEVSFVGGTTSILGISDFDSESREIPFLVRLISTT
jgi:hypothetical protein